MRRAIGIGIVASGLVATACAPKGTTDDAADETGDTETTTNPTSQSQSGSNADTMTDTGDPSVGWFQVGWGIDSFAPIESGDDFPMVYGNQGSAMFPMPIRAGEFVLPDDPRDYLDPRAPIMDLELDIEGHNDGFGGHFKRIANYPLVFEILPDGTYEFLYVAIIIPDDKDPEELAGLPAHLWVRVRPYEAEPIELDLDLVVALDG